MGVGLFGITGISRDSLTLNRIVAAFWLPTKTYVTQDDRTLLARREDSVSSFND
jgi:hypothetical protein